jgi:hypothetical protein
VIVNVTPLASTSTCVTVGLPGSPSEPEGGGVVWLVANVAVTVVAPLTVTVQVPVPLQAPLQPVKTEPEAALAVSVIGVPTATTWVQSEPQAIPAGTLVTVPPPLPFLLTDKVAVVVPVVEPLTPREMESPPAVKVTLPANAPAVVGRKRTVMAWLAPGASVNDAPETMLNGAPTLAAPERLALPVFCTVKVRSAVPPTAMLPKLVALTGVTAKSGWATPLAEGEHPLSFPLASMAVTRAKYVVPALSAVTRVETTCPEVGLAVAEATVWNDPPGQLGAVVPR